MNIEQISLYIIIPAYNEQSTITETITDLRDITSKDLASIASEIKILVIDDGSTDKTAELATLAGADYLVSHFYNRGLGAAVRTGLMAARRKSADIVIKFDADGQHDPNDLLPLIEPILQNKAEVVYGDRFERISYVMPLVRRLGNFVFTRLMKHLTGWPLKDSQPGIFAVDQKYLANFFIPGDYNYTQQILLDAYHQGMRFAQVPVSFRVRKAGKSFVSFAYPYQVGMQILRLLIGVKPMKVFAPLGLIFMLISILITGIQVSDWLLGNHVKPVENVNLVLGLSIFGLQIFLFGLLADLIVNTRKILEQNQFHMKDRN